MGAVYLASRAGRQVAVKVFLPASSLQQAEHEEFVQRLEEVLAQATSLNHPHILPVLAHGRQAGLTYLVTPYIANETLEVQLNRTGALPLARVQRYLVQLAAALDSAHTQGMLHRDIKPANILLTPEEHALLSDFGLAGLTTEKNFARVRRALPGMLNAIAPEYVLGQPIGPRADLYSLGIVLYHMVTGTPPFRGQTLAEVAVQHVRVRPPSPTSLRPDLPQAAGEVILRALAKQPDERYAYARDLASAFQLALDSPDSTRLTSALDMLADLASGTTAAIARPAVPRTGGLFDPKWQSSAPLPAIGGSSALDIETQTTAAQPALSEAPTSSARVAQTAATLGTDTTAPGLLTSATLSDPGARHTGLPGFAPPQTLQAAVDQRSFQNQRQAGWGFPADLVQASAPSGGPAVLDFTPAQSLPEPAGAPGAFAGVFGRVGDERMQASTLTSAQAPTATRSGTLPAGLPPARPQQPEKAQHGRRHSWLKIAGLLTLVVLFATASSVFLLMRTHGSAPARVKTPAPPLNASARATATANAYVILSDSLNQNVHNWPVGSQGWYTCTFEGGAYHITNNDKNRSAPALLPGQTIRAPFSYTLTMQQVKGDETVLNNLFGMILDASVQNVQGKQVDQFYAFEILNKASGQYQFWKYDNSQSGNPWKSLWVQNFGREFLQGSGPAHSNTVKIIATGTTFTFVVNGKQIGTFKDHSFSSGSLGMLVNLNGAEVAFSQFLVTHV